MKARILVVGEALWDLRAPRGVRLEAAASLALEPGGGALNVAKALAARGHRPSLACAVGDDVVGRALLARVKALGVDVGPASLGPARTGLAFIELGADGARRVVPHRARENAPPWPAGRFAAVVASGVAPGWRFQGQARAARAAGALVAVDLNARLGVFRGRPGRACLGLLRAAHVIKASRDDLGVLGIDLVGLRDRAATDALLVVTDGANPIVALGPFGELTFDVPGALAGADPTGAGDAFFAALIDALLEGGAPKTATTARHATAAIAAARASAHAHLRASTTQKPNPPRPGRERGARR